MSALATRRLSTHHAPNYIDVSHSGGSCHLVSSVRTSLPAVSRLSLGVGIWARPEPPSVDQELKYVFSSFTKIPALSLRVPGPKRIVQIPAHLPNENALPLVSLRNPESLETSYPFSRSPKPFAAIVVSHHTSSRFRCRTCGGIGRYTNERRPTPAFFSHRIPHLAPVTTIQSGHSSGIFRWQITR
ncbi:hypothetical protein EDB83DRAFT_416958 [Lactarius deliciosus]|nr:hypothetical protein EDB83DRAFT_416958 [Lactarius deliciosus]